MIEWTKEKPTIEGLYWYYGNPWWGTMNQPIDKFKPTLSIIRCILVGDFITMVCEGAFVYNGHGLFSKLPIVKPEPPKLDLPKERG